jgi:hypothetical protein
MGEGADSLQPTAESFGEKMVESSKLKVERVGGRGGEKRRVSPRRTQRTQR